MDENAKRVAVARFRALMASARDPASTASDEVPYELMESARSQVLQETGVDPLVALMELEASRPSSRPIASDDQQFAVWRNLLEAVEGVAEELSPYEFDIIDEYPGEATLHVSAAVEHLEFVARRVSDVVGATGVTGVRVIVAGLGSDGELLGEVEIGA